jgi:hypothetical protein
MGRKARMYVERNFNRKELAQKQLDVIKSFMSTVSGKSLRESPLFDG